MAQNTKAKNVSSEHEKLIKESVDEWIEDPKKISLLKITACYHAKDGDRYRVDAYVTSRPDDESVSRSKITNSYFVKIASGKVINLTRASL